MGTPTAKRIASASAAMLLGGVISAPLSLGALAVGAAINPALSQMVAAKPAAPIRLIVEARADPAPLEAEVAAAGGTVTRGYASLSAFAATVPGAEAERLNRDRRVARIDVDAPVRLMGSANDGNPAVNSDNLANRYERLSRVVGKWNQGLDGSEVQVAIIDSGVYPHDDLTQKSAAVPGNGGNRLLALTVNPNATDAIDHVGHGTHVAGILAGNGADSAGRYIGVAPNSLLVSVKVSDDAGNMTEGDVITGLEWVYIANQKGLNIKVVNLSLSSTAAQSYNTSALDAMVEKLWFSGVTVVASTGIGSGAPMYAPGNDPFVITVGSIDDYHQSDLSQTAMAPWSPYGSTQDALAKPDVVADGSHVVSLLAPGSSLAAQHPSNVVAGKYFLMGGTSMAAPQVAGMAALMLQAQPRLTNNQVKAALVQKSVPFSQTAYTAKLGIGGGFLNSSAVGAATTSAPSTNAPSASFDSIHNAILVGTAWWQDASWPNASWNSTSWNSTSWNSTSWNSTSWNGAQFASTSWNSTSWNSTSWNSTSWNSTSWNSTSWNSTSWNSTSWNSAIWNDADFS